MKTKIITLLFAFFMPFVAIADTTSPATDNDATGKIATLSYQDILNIERNKTDCATGVFAAALERTATADLETANKIDIDNWVRAAFSEKETLEELQKNCQSELDQWGANDTIRFDTVKYTFPGGREIKVNYTTQPQIFKDRLALAERHPSPADPSVDIMNDPNNVWTNTDPAWYAIMVTRHGALDDLVGPDKNNTISLDYIANHVHQLHPKNLECTGETALFRDASTKQDSLLTRSIRKHVSGFDGDENDYYVPTDQDLSWIGWAEVALDVIFTVATAGGSFLLRGGISAAQAAKVITKLRPLVKTLEQSSDVIKYMNRVKDLDKAKDALKTMDSGSDIAKQTKKTIKNLEKEIKGMNKLDDVKKYKKALSALTQAEKIEAAHKALKNAPKIRRLRRQMTDLPDTIKDLEKSTDVKNFLNAEKQLENAHRGINQSEDIIQATRKQLDDLDVRIKQLQNELNTPKKQRKLGLDNNQITKELDAIPRKKKELNNVIKSHTESITTRTNEIVKHQDDIAKLQKTDDVVKYNKTLDDLNETRNIMEAYRTLGGLGKIDQTGNVFTRAFRNARATGSTLRNAYRILKNANKTLSGASRVARSSMKSGRMRDFLFHSSRRHLKALIKMTGQTTTFITTLKTIGDVMYSITDASTSDYTSGIQFMPMLLLSADDLKGQEDVVNYGMWLMWSGSSTSATDDDAAYLQAMNYASRVHLALMEEQNGGNYPCNIDIWVVRPIIRNPDTDNPELYYMVMNDTPWTTAQ